MPSPKAGKQALALAKGSADQGQFSAAARESEDFAVKLGSEELQCQSLGQTVRGQIRGQRLLNVRAQIRHLDKFMALGQRQGAPLA